MFLDFSPISLEKQAAYLERFAKCPQKASDYSFINLWGWGEEYGLQWAWTDDLVFLKQTRPNTAYWAPVGDWRLADWPMLLTSALSEKIDFIRVPEDLAVSWKDRLDSRVKLEASPEHWDYLYRREELAELKGNRFHKKKNLVNQFLKAYPQFSYTPLHGGLIHRALELQDAWCAWRDCESSETLTAENRAIEKVLSAWDSLSGILGGALTIGDKMAAYTVAEALDPGTLVIHFEKGDPEFKGVYQAINQQFLLHAAKGVVTVNREQDLGDEGLRKAKRSYHPFEFLKKFRVTVSD